MPAKLYHYAPNTREYLPRRYPEDHPYNFAEPSPMEPGVWLVPAFATLTEPPEVPAGMIAVFDPASDSWALTPTGVVHPPPPPPTAEERAAGIRAAVAEHLDVVARAQGFKGIDDAVSYADEPAVVRFQLLGRALRAWRSLTWAATLELIDAIDAGQAAMPADKPALFGLLPAFAPPTAEDIAAATAAKLGGA